MRLPRLLPRAAWLCALVACLNAVSWSFVTPPFEAPDEQAHFAYVEQLARGGRLPSSDTQSYAVDETTALDEVQAPEVALQPQHQPIASLAQQRKLERALASAASSPAPVKGAAGVAASEPPLYYAIETVPYALAAGGGVLEQLQLMRLANALLAGLTALLTFLLLRELLPASPRVWTVGGLAAALFGGMGFIGGVVNPEALLCAVCAGIFYCLARAFRRGVTPRLAIAIGLLTAAGFLTKLNFIGVAPGVLLALIVLARRVSRERGARAAFAALAPAAAIALAPACAYVSINLLSYHRALGLTGGAIRATASHRSLLGEASYIWQLYLPRLPGMHVDFADISPPRDLWFNGLVGQYGFEDTVLPRWVDDVALALAAAMTVLLLRELIGRRAALRRRLPELVIYLTICVGLLVLVGAASYLWYPSEAAGFPEPRYLLPLTPMFGVALALAARGAGRRWCAAVGTLLVLLVLAQDLFGQLQSVARFYG